MSTNIDNITIRKRGIELKNLFALGFEWGIGDTSVFDSIRKNLKSISKSLLGVFGNPDVSRAFNNMLNTFAFNAGAKAGSFISVGSTIADNITGGIELYLSQSVNRIREWLINMFDISSRADTIFTNFQVALARIFTVFQTDEAKQITADIIQIFADGFMGVTELAAKLGTDIINTILTPITENADGFYETLNNTLAPVFEVLTVLANSFTEAWDQINQVYDDHISPLFDSITDGFSEIVGTFLNGYNTHMVPVLDELASRFTEVWDGTIHPLLENFIDLFGKVADLVKTVWENVLQPTVNWIAENIWPAVSPVLEALGMGFLNTFEQIGQTLNGFVTAAGGVIDFLTGTFSGDWEKAWEGVQTVFKGIWDAFPDVIKSPIRSIIGFINKMISGVQYGVNSVIDAVNSLSFDVPDWIPKIGGDTFGFDLERVSLPQIPQLAKGGIVDAPTLALLGEAGAEAIVPLENNLGWIDNLADSLAESVWTKYANLKIDVMPDISKYKLGGTDFTRDLNGWKAAEMDNQMLDLLYETRRQNELLEDIITSIDEKQLQVGDSEIFSSVQRSVRNFQRQTRRNPWPVLV